MRILVIIIFIIMCAGTARAQDLEIKELTKKEIRALKKQKKFDKQAARYLKQGLNAWGINEQALDIAFAIRKHVGNAPSNGNFILKPASSLTAGRTYPLWIIDKVQYDWPPQVAFTSIREVRVLETLSETTKYGQRGRAGVIEITTSNSM